MADRHYTFYHQGADKNLAEAWTKVAATRLSVGGKVLQAPRTGTASRARDLGHIGLAR